MTELDKKKKAASIAVAYYLEHEALSQQKEKEPANKRKGWKNTGRAMKMNGRKVIQCRGRVLKNMY